MGNQGERERQEEPHLADPAEDQGEEQAGEQDQREAAHRRRRPPPAQQRQEPEHAEEDRGEEPPRRVGEILAQEIGEADDPLLRADPEVHADEDGASRGERGGALAQEPAPRHALPCEGAVDQRREEDRLAVERADRRQRQEPEAGLPADRESRGTQPEGEVDRRIGLEPEVAVAGRMERREEERSGQRPGRVVERREDGAKEDQSGERRDELDREVAPLGGRVTARAAAGDEPPPEFRELGRQDPVDVGLLPAVLEDLGVALRPHRRVVVARLDVERVERGEHQRQPGEERDFEPRTPVVRRPRHAGRRAPAVAAEASESRKWIGSRSPRARPSRGNPGFRR
jgi:hypothetical protein